MARVQRQRAGRVARPARPGGCSPAFAAQAVRRASRRGSPHEARIHGRVRNYGAGSGVSGPKSLPPGSPSPRPPTLNLCDWRDAAVGTARSRQLASRRAALRRASSLRSAHASACQGQARTSHRGCTAGSWTGPGQAACAPACKIGTHGPRRPWLLTNPLNSVHGVNVRLIGHHPKSARTRRTGGVSDARASPILPPARDALKFLSRAAPAAEGEARVRERAPHPAAAACMSA